MFYASDFFQLNRVNNEASMKFAYNGHLMHCDLQPYEWLWIYLLLRRNINENSPFLDNDSINMHTTPKLNI